MRTILLVLLFALVIGKTAIAQNDTMKATPENAHVFFATAKFHLVNNLHELEGMNTVNLKIATDVSPNLLKSFFTTFNKATDDKWFFYDKKGKVYLVKFNNESKDYKVLLNKKGKVFYTMFDATEKDLSADTKKNLKAWFTDYHIVGLVHVNAPDKNGSVVNLRNQNDLLVVSIDDDVISEIGRYKLDNNFTTTPSVVKTTTVPTPIAKK